MFLKNISRQMHLEESQTLFSIDLKIGGKIVTLNVKQKDSISLLLANHQIGSMQNPVKLDKIKEKIKQSIQNQIIIKSDAQEYQLVDKLKQFLERETRLQYNNHSNSQSTYLDDQTPQKPLRERKNINKQEQIKNTPMKMEDKSFLNKVNKQKVYQDKQSQRLYKKNIPQKEYKCAKSSNSKAKTAKKIDRDLIRAYETILKKSKDKTMRDMAQVTLKQLNSYKDQVQTPPNVHIQSQALTEYSQSHSKAQIQTLSGKKYTNFKQQRRQSTNARNNGESLIFKEKHQAKSDNKNQSFFMRKNRGFSYLSSSQKCSLVYQHKYDQKQREKQNEASLYFNLPYAPSLKVNYQQNAPNFGSKYSQNVKKFNYFIN